MSHWLLPKRAVETKQDAVKLFCLPQVSLARTVSGAVVAAVVLPCLSTATASALWLCCRTFISAAMPDTAITAAKGSCGSKECVPYESLMGPATATLTT
jgi:hypothetical protein